MTSGTIIPAANLSGAASSAGAASAPPTALIYDDWYPAMRSELLQGKTLKTTMLLGIPLVLGRRSDGKLFAMRDSCPHRGIPLSCGWFDGKAVTCKYHGWAFEPVTGQCLEIPSLTSADSLDPKKIYAAALPCEERDGYAWVYVAQPGSGRARAGTQSGGTQSSGTKPAGTKTGDTQQAGTQPAGALLPPVPETAKFGARFRSAHLTADLPCSVDHGIIGLMDPAHGPFVHQSWWWRGKHSVHEKVKHFEPINDGHNQGFRMSAHAPSGNSAPYKLLGVYGEPITTTIDFVLPNRRYESIRCGDKWFSSLTTVTPTEPNQCRIDVHAAWNVFYHVPLVTSIARFFGARFVRQDQVTMIQQAQGLRHNPTLMLIDDADRPAKWYFALKQARIETDAHGTPFRHPLDGPVSLHWRS